MRGKAVDMRRTLRKTWMLSCAALISGLLFVFFTSCGNRWESKCKNNCDRDAMFCSVIVAESLAEGGSQSPMALAVFLCDPSHCKKACAAESRARGAEAERDAKRAAK